jgi:hypothetical protein
LKRSGQYQKGDECILGDDDLIDGVLLSQAEEHLEEKYPLKAKGYDFERLI